MIKNFKELIKTYIKENENPYYKQYKGCSILDFNGAIDYEGVVYQVKLSNEWTEEGFQIIEIELNDLILWIYNEKT